jgi:DNA-binding NtrC family response regulator
VHQIAGMNAETVITDVPNTREDAENPSVKPKILIVDDQKEVCVAMSRYFTVCGFDVECASELEEAEALISGNTYAALISDLHLTSIRSNEGLELVRMVRHRSPETKVIMLTAYSTPEVEKEALACGVSRVLNKPIALSILHRTVVDLLKG